MPNFGIQSLVQFPFFFFLFPGYIFKFSLNVIIIYFVKYSIPTTKYKTCMYDLKNNNIKTYVYVKCGQKWNSTIPHNINLYFVPPKKQTNCSNEFSPPNILYSSPSK